MSISESSIHGLVERHDKDLYRGNGKPGLTTRMQQAEDRMDSHEDCMDTFDERITGIDKKFWAIILLLLTLLGGVLTDVIMKASGIRGAGLVQSSPTTTASYSTSDSR